jgi:hypothetical protein
VEAPVELSTLRVWAGGNVPLEVKDHERALLGEKVTEPFEAVPTVKFTGMERTVPTEGVTVTVP